MPHGPTPPGGLIACMLADAGMNKPEPDLLNTSIALDFQISGACIPSMTQLLFYQGILHTLWPTSHQSTQSTVDCIKHSVYSCSNFTPTTSLIWCSLHSKNVTHNICQFLWKSIHQAHRCGHYWLNVPNYEQQAECHICNDFKSLAHILLECEASGQSIIWPLAHELWLKKKLPWPTLSLGLVLGCAISDFHDPTGHSLLSANQLFTIIISESMHLIWKIHCEWCIQHGADPTQCHT